MQSLKIGKNINNIEAQITSIFQLFLKRILSLFNLP